MRIGIVSENYKHDSIAIKSLLDKKFVPKVTFIPILKQVTGDDLLTPKTARLLNERIIRKQLQLIILVKDLDALPSDKNQITAIKNKSKQIIKNKITSDYLLFLVIFELEALILADIPSFNKFYGLKYQYKGNPLYQSEPKELIKQKTAKTKNQYQESKAPEIFQHLDYETVYSKHSGKNSFQSFVDELAKKIND